MSYALFSPNRRFRVRLHRKTSGSSKTGVIMVNPSVAGAKLNDHTIRKLVGFGHRWRWGLVMVGNVFSYCATDISDLALADDPVGPDNLEHLKAIMEESDRVIVAWGRLSKLPKRLQNQWKTVVKIAEKLNIDLYCLGTCQDGHPVHPLMIPYEKELELWTPPSNIR